MTTRLAYSKDFAFNAICPYYTMFPLEYPMRIIRKHKADAPIIVDPFCGRGTTIYAARRSGLTSYGFDTSPIAAAIAKAKLASAPLERVIALGQKLVARAPKDVPDNAFFKQAFARNTLRQICSLREGLLAEKRPSHESSILRAAALGCLHGPLVAGAIPSYFSNQMPRTFSSKPDYSVKFWRAHNLRAPEVDVMDTIEKKLMRISDLDSYSFARLTNVKCSDARYAQTYRNVTNVSLIITSPPYYGMRTYVQDQWLRMWFLGGDSEVDYAFNEQLSHSGHVSFVRDLARVWSNLARRSRDGAHLYVRFGALPSAKSDAKKLLRESLEEAVDWTLISVRNAQTSHAGKRQADTMGQNSTPSEEYDFHAALH